MTPVPTIEQQTGWKRGPQAVSICQDSDVLARVTEVDFDLEDEAFVRYFIARTGHDILRADCGWPSKKKAIMRASERWEKIERGKLQDCWELRK
jgi:hypothetical protein